MLTKIERRAIAAVLGSAGRTPVEVIAGPAHGAVSAALVSLPPMVVGFHSYYTTPSGGTQIRHPGAYNWPKRRVPGTRTIIVGRRWLDQAILPRRLGGLMP